MNTENSIDINKIIKSIPENVYNDKKFNSIKSLSNDDKKNIINNTYLLIKLLSSVYSWDRLPMIKILYENCESITCMKFIDLLWLVGHSFYSVYREFPEKSINILETMKYFENIIEINKKNYHLLVNLFDTRLTGYYRNTDFENISNWIIKLLTKHKIIISDSFIINSKNFISSEFHYKFMLDCIEHNKKYGIFPNKSLIKYLQLSLCHEYDENILETLIKNFKDVDPMDVTELLSYYKKNVRNLLIKNIDFDKSKLAVFAFSKIFYKADKFEVYMKVSKKSKRATKMQKVEHNFESSKVLKETVTNSINDSDLDLDLDSNDFRNIHIEIIDNDVISVCYKKHSMYDNSDMFTLNMVKGIKVIVKNIDDMQYSSIVYKEQFIRVLAHESKIDIFIWDLKNVSMEVKHYIILKNKKKPMIKSIILDNDFFEI